VRTSPPGSQWKGPSARSPSPGPAQCSRTRCRDNRFTRSERVRRTALFSAEDTTQGTNTTYTESGANGEKHSGVATEQEDLTRTCIDESVRTIPGVHTG
jgi:hypothetical protein